MAEGVSALLCHTPELFIARPEFRIRAKYRYLPFALSTGADDGCAETRSATSNAEVAACAWAGCVSPSRRVPPPCLEGGWGGRAQTLK
ncbi:MAG: hypothetical protein LBN33_02235 [Desulfovibrio sp.]|nr:hypothetical protein [Desulfovibrio sp.]